MLAHPRPALTELNVTAAAAERDDDKRKSLVQTTEHPITDAALVWVSIHGPEALSYTLKTKASRKVWRRQERDVSMKTEEQLSRFKLLTLKKK